MVYDNLPPCVRAMFDWDKYSLGTTLTKVSDEYHRETREKKATEITLKFVRVVFFHAVAPFVHEAKSLGLTNCTLVLTYINLKR